MWPAMKCHAVSLLAYASLGIVALVGCAEGTELDPSVDELTSVPAEKGTEEGEETIKVPPPSAPDETIDHEDDAGASSGGTGGGKPGGGEPGGSSSGHLACAAPQPCTSSTDLGSVSGDTGADVKTATGSTSQWFRVRVTEDDNGVVGMQLWLTATLTSPPNANFDLYVYVPASAGNALECTGVSAQSTSTGSTDTAKVKFGESGMFSNGYADDRYVTIEVRHVSGTCDPSAKWTLNIEGNK
jgi:hypothetical protein